MRQAQHGSRCGRRQAQQGSRAAGWSDSKQQGGVTARSGHSRQPCVLHACNKGLRLGSSLCFPLDNPPVEFGSKNTLKHCSTHPHLHFRVEGVRLRQLHEPPLLLRRLAPLLCHLAQRSLQPAGSGVTDISGPAEGGAALRSNRLSIMRTAALRQKRKLPAKSVPSARPTSPAALPHPWSAPLPAGRAAAAPAGLAATPAAAVK